MLDAAKGLVCSSCGDAFDRLLARGWETQDTYEDPICFFCGALISYTSPSWEDVEAGAKSVKVCNHDADCPALLCPPEPPR